MIRQGKEAGAETRHGPSPEVAGHPWHCTVPRMPDWLPSDAATSLRRVMEEITRRPTYRLALLAILDRENQSLRLQELSLAGEAAELRAALGHGKLKGTVLPLTEADHALARLMKDLMKEEQPALRISHRLSDVLAPPILPAEADGIQEAAGIKSLAVVPLLSEGYLIGALAVASTQNELDMSEQELLLAIGAQVVLAVTNVELCRHARESLACSLGMERLYRELIETATDAIFILDAHGRFAYINRQAEELSGYSQDELRGEPLFQLVPHRHRAEVKCISEQVLAGTSFPTPFEVTLRSRRGEHIPAEITLTALRTSGDLDGVQVVARDVRERRRREQERERLLAEAQRASRRLRRSFDEIGAALAAGHDLEAVLELIVRLAAEPLEAEVALLWLLEPDGHPGWLSLAAERNVTGDMKEVAHLLVVEGLVGQVISEMRPVHITNPERVPRAVDQQDASEHGDMPFAYLGVPLVSQGRPLGVLAVVRKRLQPFTGSEIELLRSFAHQASLAIERARLFENLVQEKEEFEAIVRNSADGILVLDRDRTVVDLNPAMERMLGYKRSQIIHRFCHDILCRDQDESESCQICPFFVGDPDVDSLLVSHEIPTAYGGRIMASTSYGIVRDSEGEVSRVIAIVRDVTKQAELERLRRDFVSTVSHELRTPLALIKGYVGTLLRSDITISDDIQQQFLKNINQASDRLGRLIDDLLSVSRIEAGKFSIERKHHDLVDLTRAVVEQSRVQFPEQRILVELPPESLVSLVDAGRIEEVLSNLISNAVKFSPTGHPIEVRAERVNGMARISVTDHGIGIAHENQQHVFDRFYRVETGLTRETKGVGLGLYIAKSIIDAHEGRIWVQSHPGEGSTFGFDLLLVSPRELGDSLGVGPRLHGGSQEVHPSSEIDSARKVDGVDDQG